MSNLLYLGLAVVVSIVGVSVLWLRHRPSSSPTSSVEEFSSKMRALAPDRDEPVAEPEATEDLQVVRRRKRRN